MSVTKEDRERWADEYGYIRGRCPIHGVVWSDTGPRCPYCEETEDDGPQEEE